MADTAVPAPAATPAEGMMRVDEAELRLVLASTDAAFQEQLNAQLLPVLAQLQVVTSDADAAAQLRSKVVALCAHLSKRLKSNPGLTVPLDGLVELVLGPFRLPPSPLQQALALVYLELGYPRASQAEQQRLLPRLLAGLIAKPRAEQSPSQRQQQHATLFHLALPVLAQYTETKDPSGKTPPPADPLGLHAHPALLKFLLTQFLDVMMFQIAVHGKQRSAFEVGQAHLASKAVRASPTTPTSGDPDGSKPQTQPGLHLKSLQLIWHGNAPWTTQTHALAQLKVGLLKLMDRPTLMPNETLLLERFLIYLVAADMPQPDVASLGDLGLKRYRLPPALLENPLTAGRLYFLYQGSAALHNDAAIPPALWRPPGSMLLKIRVLGYLGKCHVAAQLFPSNMEVAMDAVFGVATGDAARVMGPDGMVASSIVAGGSAAAEVSSSKPPGPARTGPLAYKLRIQGLYFLQWVLDKAGAPIIAKIGPALLPTLLTTLDTAQASGSQQQEEAIRGAVYEAIGRIVRRLPHLVGTRADLALVRRLFHSLEIEAANVRSSIQSALESILVSLAKLQTASTPPPSLPPPPLAWEDDGWAALLETHADSPVSNARYMAVRYANRLFPFTHLPRLWFCLKAAIPSIENKLMIREEALLGLTFPASPAAPAAPSEAAMAVDGDGGAVRPTMPHFADAVAFLSAKLVHARVGRAASPTTPAIAHPPLPSPATLCVGTMLFQLTLRFLHQLLILTAAPQPTETAFDDLLFSDLLASGEGAHAKHVKQLLERWVQTDATRAGLIDYCRLLEAGLSAKGTDAVLQVQAAHSLREMLILSPIAPDCATATVLAQRYASSIAYFAAFVLTPTRATYRGDLSHIWAFLLADPAVSSSETLKQAVDALRQAVLTRDLTATAFLLSDATATTTTTTTTTTTMLPTATSKVVRQASTDAIEGVVQGLGHLLAQIQYRGRRASVFAAASDDWLAAIQALAQFCVSAAGTRASSGEMGVTLAAIAAIGSIGLYDDLGLPFASDETAASETVTATAAEPHIKPITATALVHAILSLLKTTKETKMREPCILALGQLGVGARDPDLYELLLNAFYELPGHFSKEIELHFAIADAFSLLALGWDATLTERFRDLSNTDAPSVHAITTDQRDAYWQGIMKKFRYQLRPGGPINVRKGYCFLILSLLKYGGRSALVQASLLDFHTILSELLTDLDDFTQDLASKGIGLIYELGSDAVKQQLLDNLLSTFSEGKRLAPVTGDTQVFVEGAVGTTPEGKPISTYQSVLRLASDLNQPNLVYKFMSLASHSALWNSRRGASMGFATIARHAEKELAPMLPQIIPKLFQYRHDPNPKIAASMTSIWQALVKNPSQSIETYFVAIMDDVLANMQNRQWRLRAASCNAMAQLLQNRDYDTVQPYFERIWQTTFAVLDDINSNVRSAAHELMKTLNRTTLRFADPQYVSPERGAQLVGLVVPFLLEKGMGSRAKELIAISLDTLLKLIKRAGPLIKSQVVPILLKLLESLSTLEPQAANYLTFHMDDQSRDSLDQARLAMAKGSPMMEGIEAALRQLDVDTVAQLVPGLVALIKRGLGLPTRAGCARLVLSMVIYMPLDVKPHADTLLKAFTTSLKDSNAMIRKSAAVAIAYLSKIASLDALDALLATLQSAYLASFDANDAMVEAGRMVPGVTLREMLRHSADAFRPLENGVMPLAFLGARDPTPALAEPWQQIWDELTAGAATRIRLYKKELLALTVPLLDAPNWGIKRQAARTLRDLATVAGAELAADVPDLVDRLQRALAGRVWAGKEDVLEALARVVIHGKAAVLASAALTAVLMDVLAREARKPQDAYRRMYLVVMPQIVDALALPVFDSMAVHLDAALAHVATLEQAAEARKAARLAAQTHMGPAPMDLSDDDGDDDAIPVTADPKVPAIKASLGLQTAALTGYGVLWPADGAAMAALAPERIDAVLQTLARHLTHHSYATHLAAMDGVLAILTKLADASAPPGEAGRPAAPQFLLQQPAFSALTAAIAAAAQDTKYITLRQRAAECIDRIEKLTTSEAPAPAAEQALRAILREAFAPILQAAHADGPLRERLLQLQIRLAG